MASVVYALYGESAPAQAAKDALRRAQPKGTLWVAQLHDRAPLEGNELPEGATQFGRNIVLAMAGGAGFMATAGGIAGALDLMLGMTIGVGIGLGAITGALMGLVGAMQAGTRHPKSALLQLQPRIAAGAVLLLIELPNREVPHALDVLELGQPEALDSLD